MLWCRRHRQIRQRARVLARTGSCPTMPIMTPYMLWSMILSTVTHFSMTVDIVAVTCQMGVRISSTSALVTSETGIRPMRGKA